VEGREATLTESQGEGRLANAGIAQQYDLRLEALRLSLAAGQPRVNWSARDTQRMLDAGEYSSLRS
jgi:hypothetical protein